MGRLRDKLAWHRRARRQLQCEPLCAMCLSEGRIVAASVADHIEPHHNDPIKFWTGRLQSLCAHCHESRNSRSAAASTTPSDPMACPRTRGIRSIGISSA